MASSVFEADVDALGKETLQDVDSVLVSGRVVDGCIAVHVDFDRGQASFYQQPDHLEVTFVTGPVQRCVPAHFGSVFRRHKRVRLLSVKVLNPSRFLFFGLLG